MPPKEKGKEWAFSFAFANDVGEPRNLNLLSNRNMPPTSPRYGTKARASVASTPPDEAAVNKLYVKRLPLPSPLIVRNEG